MSKNGYLEMRQALNQGFLDVGEQLGMQKMWDYVQASLRNPKVLGRAVGKKAMKRLYTQCKYYADRYHICFTDDVEADVYQEELDGLIKESCDEEDFHPFRERYPWLKKLGYNKARKGWK